jgi:hypothetical protein
LQFLGNNSKTVNKKRNLILSKNDQDSKIYLPVSEEKIFKKFTDGRRTPSGGNSSHDPPFGSGELKMKTW